MTYCNCGCGTRIPGDNFYVRGHATRLDPEQQAEYQVLFDKGLTFAEVGKEMGVTRQQAHNVYKKYFSDSHQNGKVRRSILNRIQKLEEFSNPKTWPDSVIILYRLFKDRVQPVIKTNRVSKVEAFVDGDLCKIIESSRTSRYMSFRVKNIKKYAYLFIVWKNNAIFKIPTDILQSGKQYYIPIEKREEVYKNIKPEIDFYQYLIGDIKL